MTYALCIDPEQLQLGLVLLAQLFLHLLAQQYLVAVDLHAHRLQLRRGSAHKPFSSVHQTCCSAWLRYDSSSSEHANRMSMVTSGAPATIMT